MFGDMAGAVEKLVKHMIVLVDAIVELKAHVKSLTVEVKELKEKMSKK